MKCIILLVKKYLLWIWKILGHSSRKLLGWQCGDRSAQTLTALCDKAGAWNARRIYADRYAVYADVIGAKQLRQGKSGTYQLEQNNALQRHWIGRFRRRTQIVSRSVEMIDATLALFARFRVNGNIQELISLLR